MEDIRVKVAALSQRQKEILRLISKHLQAKEVARLLNISERTVKTHTNAARKRLGVATSRDAARLLIQHEATVPHAIVSKAIVLEGLGPSRTIDERLDDLSLSTHEQAILSERVALLNAMERSGDRVAHAGDAEQAGPYQGYAQGRSGAQPNDGPGSGGVHYDRGNSLADRRWAGFERRLASLNAFQWLGLIALVGVFAAVLVGGLITTSLGALEAIEAIHRQAG